MFKPEIFVGDHVFKPSLLCVLRKAFFLQKEAFLRNLPLGWFKDMIYLTFYGLRIWSTYFKKQAENSFFFFFNYGLRI